MGPLSVCVVVCAYSERRWDDLVRGLRAVASQTRPADRVVVVIDHNEGLLARAREAFPEVTVVPNTRRRGLSGARNTAIAEAAEDVVAFLDDDAAPETDWLARLLAPYADENVLASGGSAQPVWPGERPAFLPAELDWVVGCTFTGQPGDRAPVRNLMGCNMSFRRWVLEEVGDFDESVGRVGALPRGCEETELCIRVHQRLGGDIVFEPTARVHHRVTDDRVTWHYLRHRSWSEGTSKAAISRTVGARDATADERRYVGRVLPAGLRRELGRALHGDRGGLSAALGIVTSVLFTVMGYLRGQLPI